MPETSTSASSTASSRTAAKPCSPAKQIKRLATAVRKANTKIGKPPGPSCGKALSESRSRKGDVSPELSVMPAVTPVVEMARSSEAGASPQDSPGFASAEGSPGSSMSGVEPLSRTRRSSEGDYAPATSTPDNRLMHEIAPKPRSESSLLRIKAQLRAAATAELEASIRQAEEPGEEERGANVSVISGTSLSQGGALHEMPRLANVLLQKTKTRLEESRNMSREIREDVSGGLHGLYEMVLRLADSRNRHIAEKERQRANYERRMSQIQAKHADALESLTRAIQEPQRMLLESLEKSRKEIEASRWIALEAEALNKENAKVLDSLVTRGGGPGEEVARGGTISERELRLVQEDIATLRLELGTLNMNLESAKVLQVQQPPAPPAASAGLRPGVSFADALSTPKHGIILESIEPRHTSEDVIGIVKSKVDVIRMGIGINKVSKLRGQRVVINCDTEGDRVKLRKALAESDSKLTVADTRPKRPLLRLVGVVKDLTDPQVEEAILSQNKGLLTDVPEEQKKLKVLRRTRGRTDLISNIIVEVSPALWQRLRDNKLRIGYQVVSTFDQSPIMQCYNCMGFGHRATECRNETRCGHCAGTHDSRGCTRKNEAPTCANCQSAGKAERAHTAFSSNCSEWEKWDRIARSSVAYC